jgi:DNA-binding NarL/FixJ family response regulator
MSGSEANPIRVVIVDDQPLIRQGFAMILGAQADINVVGEAADGRAALDEIDRADPDVVLMDIRMPGLDGVDATRRLRTERDRPRVLIVTTFNHDEYVSEALAAGAAGFVLKDATPEELVHAVRVVAAGDALLSPAVTTRLLEQIVPQLNANSTRRPAPSAISDLTEREVEMLLLVGRGLSNIEISRDRHISEATVKTHISHILAKLGLRDRVQAVIAAYELGLLVPAGDETADRPASAPARHPKPS